MKIELDIDKLVAQKGEGALAALGCCTLLTLKQRASRIAAWPSLLKTTEKAVR